MPDSIAIVSSVPLTEPVVRNRLYPFFNAFVKKGYCVYCVCPKGYTSYVQLPSGVHVKEVDINFFKPNSFIKRALKEAKDVSLLLKEARSIDSNKVMVTIPSMFLAFLAPFYISKKIVYIDIRDLSWEYLADTSLVQRISKRVFRYLFKRSINFYKLISATNETELDYIKGVNPKLEVMHVSNGIRLEQFNELKGVVASQEDKFTVTYMGNIGLAQQLGTLVEAAQLLPDINFKIVGSGIDEQRIQILVKEYGLNNVSMLGRVSWQEVIKYYNDTHILYAQLTPNYAGAMPSKLYEYLSTGKHVVYGGQGQAEMTLKKFESYDLIEPCKPKLLANKLSELKSSMNRYYLSKENQDVIEKYYIRENSVKLFVDRV